MDYDLETELDGDYFHIHVAPTGTTTLNELAGRMERHGLEYNDSLNGYDVETHLGDESIEIHLDLSTGKESPDALVGATEELHQYLSEDELPEEFIEQFSGGAKHTDTFPYK